MTGAGVFFVPPAPRSSTRRGKSREQEAGSLGALFEVIGSMRRVREVVNLHGVVSTFMGLFLDPNIWSRGLRGLGTCTYDLKEEAQRAKYAAPHGRPKGEYSQEGAKRRGRRSVL